MTSILPNAVENPQLEQAWSTQASTDYPPDPKDPLQQRSGLGLHIRQMVFMLWLISVAKYFILISTTVCRLCNEGVTHFNTLKRQIFYVSVLYRYKKYWLRFTLMYNQHFNDAGPIEYSKAQKRQRICF